MKVKFLWISIISVAALLLLIIFVAIPLLTPNAEKDIVGHWEGSITAGGQTIPIKVDFGDEGKLSGSVDIPMQGANKLPLANIKYDPPHLSFELHTAMNGVAFFEGTVTNDEISGDFAQNAIPGKFTLKRGAGAFATSASTAPAADAGAPITLKTPTGDIQGSLMVPANVPAKCPVVLIIAGSGPTNRDGNNPGIPGANNCYKLLAQGFASNGIASLRYDKRGVGASRAALKSEADIRFEDYINDAAGWVNLLRADSRFGNITVLGHSEGSLIGMVAANQAHADGYISIAGAGRPAADILREQLTKSAPQLMPEVETILKLLESGQTVAKVSPDLQQLFHASVQPYLISWFKYNPATEVAKLKMPVLIIQGSTDLQVSVKDAELLHQAKPDAQFKVIDGMNHVLKTAPAERAANIATYSDPSLPLAAGLMDSLIGFVAGIK
jgi:pimeloyl-ACP methyl ester carboxylesterase